MPRRKELHKYPEEYFMLFRMASIAAITVVHETPEQANATRNDLYTFRSTLYKEGTDEGLISAAQNVRLTITDATLVAEPIRGKKNENTDTTG